MAKSPAIILFDSNGLPMAVEDGVAIPESTHALLAAGSDGSDARVLLVDASGRQILVGAGTAGDPHGGVVTIQGQANGTPVPISGSFSLPSGAATETTLASRLAESTFTGRINTLGQKAMADSTPVALASDQSALSVTGAVSVSGSDGTGSQAVRVFDADSGAGAQWVLGVQLRRAASGGSVEAGTSTTPIRVDPTGTTAQPVSGTVAVSNFPATQPVSGSVSVSNFPATQPVSASALPLPTGASTSALQTTGNTSLGNIDTKTPALVGGKVPVDVGTPAVSVSNLPATQAVSAASLPLPTGASTAAKQPAFGTAGTASADVLTVQGVASMTALKVDGSGVTQPVSGSVAVSNFPATQPVSAAALPLPSGASTSAAQTTGNNSLSSIDTKVTGLALDATLTGGTQKAILRAGAKGSTTAADVTSVAAGANHQALAVAIVDGSGNQVTSFGSSSVSVTNFPATQPVSGSVSVSNFPATQPVSGSVSVSNFPATQPVSLASAVPVTDNSGSLTVDTPQLPAALVSGRLSVDGSAVTQPVSAAALPLPSGAATSALQGTGNTSLGNIDTKTPALVSGRVPVDGSGVTQPVSAASLPLPTGAATSAKQPALGTAGTPSTDVLTVQGRASMTPLLVDGSAVTQPVSGTVTANIGTAGSIALDATLTGGNQKSIVRGGAKGATTAADVTSLAVGTNHQALVVALVDALGNQLTSFGPPISSTTSVTSVPGAVASTQLLAANANRVGSTIYNDSSSVLYVKLGTTASNTSFTVKVLANGYYEVPFGYNGRIDGIWASATGNARITELS